MKEYKIQFRDAFTPVTYRLEEESCLLRRLLNTSSSHKGSVTSVINLKEEGFQHLLCLTRGETVIGPSNIYWLLQAALYFTIDSVVEMCIDYLWKNDRVDNTLYTSTGSRIMSVFYDDSMPRPRIRDKCG